MDSISKGSFKQTEKKGWHVVEPNYNKKEILPNHLMIAIKSYLIWLYVVLELQLLFL